MFNRSGFRSGGYGDTAKATIPEDFSTSNGAVLSKKRHARGFEALFAPPTDWIFFFLHIKVMLAGTPEMILKIEHVLNTCYTPCMTTLLQQGLTDGHFLFTNFPAFF